MTKKLSQNQAHGPPWPHRPRSGDDPEIGSKRIVVTDRSRLGKLLIGGEARAHASTRLLDILEASLESALGVEPDAVPEGLVTMNSQVRLVDLDSGVQMTCRVVYPQDVEFVADGVSVVDPLGLSLIGSHVGQCVRWQGPCGWRRMLIEEVLYQPEQEGEFHR